MGIRDEDSARTRRRNGTAIKEGRGIIFHKTITVDRPVHEVFSFWRHLENLPKFMTHLHSVHGNGGNISHWVARANGTTLTWDAETIEMRMNEVIAWQSLPAAEVNNSGSIHFKPGVNQHGTVVNVELKYAPPRGKETAKVAKVFGKDTKSIIEEDIERFRGLMERKETSMAVGLTDI